MDSLTVPERNLLVTARHDHVVALWEEANRGGVKAKILLIANWFGLFSTLNRVERKLLVPRTRHEQVVRSFKFLRAKSDCPNWMLALVDGEQLTTSFVLHQDGSIEKTDSKELSIWRPVARYALGWSLGLVDALAIRHPKTKVDACARGQCLQHRVEAKSLDLLVVGVLEKSLAFCRPNDNSIVGTTRCKPLAIFRVSKAINGILVTYRNLN